MFLLLIYRFYLINCSMYKSFKKGDIILGNEILESKDIALLPLNEKGFGNHVKFVDIPNNDEEYIVYKIVTNKKRILDNFLNNCQMNIVYVVPKTVLNVYKTIVVNFFILKSNEGFSIYHISKKYITNIETGQEYMNSVLKPLIIQLD